MSIGYNTVNMVDREECALCGNRQLDIAVELPDLPLTGKFSKKPMGESIKGFDQRLLICPQCNHAQLAVKVPSDVLYDDSYSFRTSLSMTAQKGTSFFLNMLDSIAPEKHFKCVLDVGCNDLFLLKKLKGRAEVRVGIDPLWISKEDQREDKEIQIIGDTIENVDLNSILKVQPDLIVCRHTLEHIFEPKGVLEQLFDVANKETLFLFEIPAFEPLVLKIRFDQIFHQHVQYFSLYSFKWIIENLGGTLISYRENYHDWGALLIAFTKQGDRWGKCGGSLSVPFTISEIKKRYSIFQRQMAVTNEVLESFKGKTIYGYGAAQMLPVMAYHLNNDLSLLDAVLDDDMNKDRLYYWNLPINIRHVTKIQSLSNASVFITAVDNIKPIISKLMVRRPRHIIYPFHII